MKKIIPIAKKTLASIVFTAVLAFNSTAQITITEIMYNPPESGSDSLEFIEMVNTSFNTINLNAYTLTGVSHTFGANDSILSGQYYVGAVDSAAFRNVFGFDADFEWTSGALSNAGEFIVLKNNLGFVVDSVDYDDASPWDSRADGNGPSLVLCDSLSDNNLGVNWYAAQTPIAGPLVNGFQIYANPGSGASCFKLAFTIDTAISCAGKNDGAVSISQTGGIAPISYLWSTGDTTFSVDTLSGGNYSVVSTDDNGLVDSISFSISSPAAPTSTISIAECDQFIWGQNGITYTSSGIFRDTIKDALGCDSIFILDLTINLPTSSFDTVIACDDYLWLGSLLTVTGTYSQTIANATNCDSIVSLDLTIINSSTSTLIDTITSCDSYIWMNDTLNATGIYFDTIPNAANCDSVLTLNLTIINSTSTIVLDTAVCNDFNWTQTGELYDSTGIYSDTLVSVDGCDSIVSLDLKVRRSETIFNETVCDTNFFVWRSDTLRATGTYIDTLTNQFACDSLIILELRISAESFGTDTAIACSVYNFFGTPLIMSGDYVDTIINVSGCDSIVELNLTILSPTDTTILDTGCTTFSWFGDTLTASGIYVDTLVNAVGCDSIITLNLTMESTFSTVVDFGCYSYTWSQTGLTYDSSGLYSDTIANAANCDSIITLDLTLQANDTIINVLSCDGFFEWRGDTLVNDGIYIDTITNSFNCDSIIILDLIVKQPALSFDTITTCDQLIWLGDTLTMSGTYMDTIPSSTLGCDSMLTLELTILNSTGSTVRDTACDSYRWSVSGQTYSSTGTYVFVDTNSVGCDSLITLELLILNSSSSTEVVDECISYVWPQTGLTYSQSGIYTDTLTNTLGCDSVLFLNLNLRKVNNTLIKRNFLLISQQLNATSYQWLDCINDTAITGATGQQYLVEENGTYAVEVNFDGCIDTSFCIEVVNVGIEEYSAEARFSINPNPAKNSLNITFENTPLNGFVFQIMDITGSLVKQFELNNNKQQLLDISNLNSGIYILRYGNISKKLIITE